MLDAPSHETYPRARNAVAISRCVGRRRKSSSRCTSAVSQKQSGTAMPRRRTGCRIGAGVPRLRSSGKTRWAATVLRRRTKARALALRVWLRRRTPARRPTTAVAPRRKTSLVAHMVRCGDL
jgi:hypothetical protein